MSRPIERTPPLEGDDADRFLHDMLHTPKASPEEMARRTKEAAKFVERLNNGGIPIKLTYRKRFDSAAELKTYLAELDGPEPPEPAADLDRFRVYLARLSQPHRLPKAHADRVRHVWGQIEAALGDKAGEVVPGATKTGEGALQLHWSTAWRYVDVEVYEGGFHWFASAKGAGPSVGSEDEDPLLTEVPDELIAAISNVNQEPPPKPDPLTTCPLCIARRAERESDPSV